MLAGKQSTRFEVILAVLAAIFFIVALPFLSQGENYSNILVGGILSLVLIFAAFALTIKKGSGIVGSIMIIMGTFFVYSGYQSFRLLLDTFATTASNDGADAVSILVFNVSGMVDYLIATVILGTMMVALGTMTIMRYLRGRYLNTSAAYVNTGHKQ